MIASIPSDIQTLDRLASAQFYATTLGWAVHPLLAPDNGDPHERGKKPILKGWRNHTAAEISPDFLAKYFGPGTNNNIGCVVRPPFIHVDLDSKPDAGAYVMAWLATQPDLAAVPRERTGGGAHLALICRDIPRGCDEGEEGAHLPDQRQGERGTLSGRVEPRAFAVRPQERPHLYMGGHGRHPRGEMGRPVPVVRIFRAGSGQTWPPIQGKTVVVAVERRLAHAGFGRGDGRSWPPGCVPRPGH